jgi:hypothetical protein
MKKNVILFVFVVFNSFWMFSQTKEDSVLNSLMQQQKWFDVRDYLSQHKDSISEMYYFATKSVLDTYLNKPDSAIMNIGILLAKYSKEIGGGSFNYAILLAKNFIEVQKYDEAINLLKDLLRQVGDALPKVYIDNFNSWISSCEFYKNHPLRVIFNENGPSETDFKMQLVGLSLESKINGVRLQTLLDTGYSSNRMSKETADRIGIHTYLSDTILTDQNLKILKGVIDSVEIENIIIYNCPVDVTIGRPDITINQEMKEKIFSVVDSAYSNYNNLIVGISTMKLIEIINVNFLNKKISFEQSNSSNQQPSNIFIIDNLLYLYTTLNNQPFVSVFDTGYSVGTFLNKEYYDNNKMHFNTKDEVLHEIRSYYADALDTIEYKNLYNIELKSYNQNLNLTNAMVAINRPFIFPNYPTLGGIIGNDFLKMLKTMKLDFKNMCIIFESCNACDVQYKYNKDEK